MFVSVCVMLAVGLALAAETKDPKKEMTVDKQAKPQEQTADPVVVFETSMGNLEVLLDQAKAPISVKNFLQYVKDGFFDGTIFHRVINKFMIQGGGFTADMKQKPTRETIKNEAHNGLKNLRGTIAMARTNVVDSATAQFFINVEDNAFLDHRAPDPQGYGYAVFGKVIAGMDVIDKIKVVKTTSKNGHENVPETPVVLKKAYLKK